jgi:hypothetical protein
MSLGRRPRALVGRDAAIAAPWASVFELHLSYCEGGFAQRGLAKVVLQEASRAVARTPRV